MISHETWNRINELCKNQHNSMTFGREIINCYLNFFEPFTNFCICIDSSIFSNNDHSPYVEVNDCFH